MAMHAAELTSTVSEVEIRQRGVIEELSKTLPLNNYDLPRAIYRIDQLPLKEQEQEQEQKEEPTNVQTQVEEDGQDEEEINLEFGTEETEEEEEDTGGGGGVEALSIHQLLGYHSADGYQGGEGEGEGEGSRALVPGEQLGVEGERGEGGVSLDLQRYAMTCGYTPDELRNALVPLNYDEGYPSLPDGNTFWNQLPFEPPEAFAAFQAFLHMGSIKQGLRILADFPEFSVNHGGPAVDLEQAITYYHTYYWNWRSLAYDVYVVQNFRRQTEYRMMQVVDDHFTDADKLMGRLREYLEDEEEFWEMMSPKVAVDLLGKIVHIQRISAGLPSTGPPNANQKAGNSSGMDMEVMLQSGSRKSRGGGGRDSIDLGGGQSLEQISQDALSDPETADLFQRLIIRMTPRED